MINSEIRLIVFFVAEDGEVLSAKTGPRADCVSNHQLLIAQFRLILNKIRKRD